MSTYKRYTYDDLLKLKEDKWGISDMEAFNLFSDEYKDRIMTHYFGENWKGEVEKDEIKK